MRISDWSSDVCSSDLSRACARHCTVYGTQQAARSQPGHSLCDFQTLARCRIDHQVHARMALHRRLQEWKTTFSCVIEVSDKAPHRRTLSAGELPDSIQRRDTKQLFPLRFPPAAFECGGAHGQDVRPIKEQTPN